MENDTIYIQPKLNLWQKIMELFTSDVMIYSNGFIKTMEDDKDEGDGRGFTKDEELHKENIESKTQGPGRSGKAAKNKKELNKNAK